MKDKFDKIKNILNKNINIKRTYLLVIIVVSLGLLAVYFSYALFTVTAEKKGVLNITAGNLYPKITSVDLDENNQISLGPNSEKQIEVTIENINSIDATYKLYYKIIQATPGDGGVRTVGLADSTRDTSVTVSSFNITKYGSSNNKKVATIVLKNTGIDSCTIELGVKVGLYGKPITLATGELALTTLSGLPNPPELVGNMVMVVPNNIAIDYGTGAQWKKDGCILGGEQCEYSKQYDYSIQQWANAITPTQDISYIKVGDTIPMSLIKTMWVWIPRFEYKITGTYGTHLNGTAGTSSLPGAIDINFIGKNVTTAKSGYRIHPAFEFDGKQLAGIWVSKFNVGGATTTTPIEYSIKPNVKATNNLNFYNMFNAASSETTMSSWGFSPNGNYDMHMMKNIDYAAIYYLSQSEFGKYGNSNFTGANKEVYMNNSTLLYTGRSSGKGYIPVPINSGVYSYDGITCTSEDCTGNTTAAGKLLGEGASTTGNLTGVYDMNWASTGTYVAANYDEYGAGANSGIPSSSWFSSNTKYYDNYGYATMTTACNNSICYGHAFSETNNWYTRSSNSTIFTTTNAFLKRGALGINTFTGGNGASGNGLFKVTITP